MLVYNNDVVQIFNKFADLLDIKGQTNFVFAPLTILMRGWFEAEDVLNSRSWKELKKLLKR
ncbi:MAG: hypothetical protein AMS17_04205 [Spirochaetes bacterium DG_61]|jgi:hypothetical protein|nr:MAG: hypothetical protein AMS17_04205 [Spirochaetes bacterium DG_61]